MKSPQACRHVLLAVALALLASTRPSAKASVVEFETKSGIRTWVDPETPEDRQLYKSSRGDSWELVMSDEFNSPERSFQPGEDHMWTSLEKPDGVNAALEVYSHNMTSTACDDDGTCYFYIKVIDEPSAVQIWNNYQNPPGYKDAKFFYRSAMVQTWNKFCFQGGMVEVRAQIPGAVGANSGNPDLAGGPHAHASMLKYYPTWPGIWMMGNLGRAIFTASTNRMWPFSYSECNSDVFNSSNQRISACDANPGSGMHPYHGRGAPEIDILEGGGTDISASVQLGPGMPKKFRMLPPDDDDNIACIYSSSCVTPGANAPGIPTKVYEALRPYKTWYQGLRYAANNFCLPSATNRQGYAVVEAALAAGVNENVCTLGNCPGSRDPNSDLGFMTDNGVGGASRNAARWGINTNGNLSPRCEKTDVLENVTATPRFEYQMDALSANWPVHMAAYTDYLVYQVEWMTGKTGYIRWMLSGQPLYEIPARAITNPPQDAAMSNPIKIMLEEPMYMIFNAAVSSFWGSQPPNPGRECRGDGNDPVTNKICDSFPMYLKIDYIRVYQDTAKSSDMQVGCDPASHPTKQWIDEHLDEYEDAENKVVDVSGHAFCRTHDDCTIAEETAVVTTGWCVHGRCKCNGATWTGPRCTRTINVQHHSSTSKKTGSPLTSSFGPSWCVTFVTFGLTMVATCVIMCIANKAHKKQEALRKQAEINAANSAMAPAREPVASDVVILQTI
ncbi:Beta-glucan synthesis-associated protein, partial [Globisporangium splendens]